MDANLVQSNRAAMQRETDVGQLVAFAVDALPPLRNSSGLYCYDKEFGGPRRSESTRYSLMVLLGASRAEAAGIDTGINAEQLLELCLSRQRSFTPGDCGLAVWAQIRLGSDPRAGALGAIAEIVNENALTGLPGMEVAWIVTGLAEAVHAGQADHGLLTKAVDHLKMHRRASSGLFYHYGEGHIRRHLPNFATEIYSVAALTRVGSYRLDDDALDLAVATAELLLASQRADGGWPWLYHAASGRVVEEYEIYSVHQDAMAPMALLPLTEATGDSRFADAAIAGMPWSCGANELRANLIERDSLFAHRSIRRRWPWSRAALTINSGLALSGRAPVHHLPAQLELNRTSRPYHLGWILEAWSGWAPRPPAASAERGISRYEDEDT